MEVLVAINEHRDWGCRDPQSRTVVLQRVMRFAPSRYGVVHALLGRAARRRDVRYRRNVDATVSLE